MRRREEGFHEKSKLLAGQSAKEGYGNSELAKNIRSASVGHLGGSKSLGHFRVAEQPHIRGLPKSYSVAADGSPSHLTPTQLGRQELYCRFTDRCVGVFGERYEGCPTGFCHLLCHPLKLGTLALCESIVGTRQ